MSIASRIRRFYAMTKTAWAIRKYHVTKHKSAVINGIPLFQGSGLINIGKEVKINSGMRFNPIGGQDGCIFDTRKSGSIVIGNGAKISNSAFIASTSITIGDNVFIGGSCKFYDTDFHSVYFEQRIQKDDPNIKSRSIIVKDGAFIGAHSIVLKGVTIGNQSVVGAGSVVTHDIPDGEIWAGNPARFVKKIVQTENNK